MRSLAINLAADFDDPGGWGRHARCFGAALARYARVAPLRRPRARQRRHEGEDALPLPPRRWDDTGAGISLATPGELVTVPGRVLVFATVWETTHLPGVYAQHLRRADQVWVPTAWGRDLFLRAGLAPGRLRVVPEGVDAERFRPAAHLGPRALFRFLCIGKWEARKGTADLVRTFCRAFRPEEPVELVMRCDHPHAPGIDVRALVIDELRRADRAAARIVVSDPLPFDGLVRLLQSCDAFVLPTRAEAWGLPILEAMACGLPCIVTDHGGHRAFADATNSFLIAVERMCRAGDSGAFAPHVDWGEWALPDLDHLAHLMRYVYEHPSAARAKGATPRRHAVERWSWDHAARSALRQLEELLAAPVARSPQDGHQASPKSRADQPLAR